MLFWEKGPHWRKSLKSAIQDIINSVNKLSCLPKQEDKECSLCLKFNTVVEWSPVKQVFLWVCYRRGDGDQLIYLAYSSLFIRRKLQHSGNNRKWANWNYFLILFFFLALRHTVLNQSNKARIDPDTYSSCVNGNVVKILSPWKSNLFCVWFTRPFFTQFCQLIHQCFDIIGILRDKIRQRTYIQDIWKRKVD